VLPKTILDDSVTPGPTKTQYLELLWELKIIQESLKCKKRKARTSMTLLFPERVRGSDWEV
jgi:hypothetical protein